MYQAVIGCLLFDIYATKRSNTFTMRLMPIASWIRTQILVESIGNIQIIHYRIHLHLNVSNNCFMGLLLALSTIFSKTICIQLDITKVEINAHFQAQYR